MKVRISLFIALMFLCHDSSAQIGRLALSPLQTIEQKIGLTDISIVYCRPSMRGSEIFGELVPYNKMWRTGANRNTTIELSEDFLINSTKVKAGKYAVFTIPNKDHWEVIFYNDTSNWDVPEDFDEEKVVARTKVKSEKRNTSLEVLSMSIGDFTNYKFDYIIEWSDTRITIPIALTTKEMMDEKISKTLSGPSYDDYYLAALYQLETGKDYKEGLKYALKTIEMADKVTWWDHRLHAFFLMELGETEEAKQVIQKGMELAEKDNYNRAYGINELNKILQRAKN